MTVFDIETSGKLQFRHVRGDEARLRAKIEQCYQNVKRLPETTHRRDYWWKRAKKWECRLYGEFKINPDDWKPDPMAEEMRTHYELFMKRLDTGF